MVKPEGPQMTSQYGAYELHAKKARLRIHARTRTHAYTHNIHYIYCFSTAAMIRERGSVLRYMYIVCLVDMKLVSYGPFQICRCCEHI